MKAQIVTTVSLREKERFLKALQITGLTQSEAMRLLVLRWSKVIVDAQTIPPR